MALNIAPITKENKGIPVVFYARCFTVATNRKREAIVHDSKKFGYIYNCYTFVLCSG
jgi:hypothetical protein